MANLSLSSRCEPRALSKRALSWEQGAGCPWPQGGVPRAVRSTILASSGSCLHRLCPDPRGQEARGLGHLASPRPEGSCREGNQIPQWLWGAWPFGQYAELHTRCQPQQKSGGSSRDPEPQPGTTGGQRRLKARRQTQGSLKAHKEEGGRGSRERRGRKGSRGKEKLDGVGGARPGVRSRGLSRGQQSLHQ